MEVNEEEEREEHCFSQRVFLCFVFIPCCLLLAACSFRFSHNEWFCVLLLVACCLYIFRREQRASNVQCSVWCFVVRVCECESGARSIGAWRGEETTTTKKGTSTRTVPGTGKKV